MMNRYTTAALSLSVLAGCSASPETQTPPPIEQTLITEFQEGFEAYDQAFDCPVDVAIQIGRIAGNAAADGFVVAAGEPGNIQINAEIQNLAAETQATIVQNAATTGAHEAVHACQAPSEPLAEPFPLGATGTTVTQFQGLSIETTEGMITSIEEGVAEVVAEAATGQASIHSPYAQEKQITEQLMSSSGMSVEQAATYVQNSDVYGFIGQIMRSDEPTPEDLANIVMFYQQ